MQNMNSIREENLEKTIVDLMGYRPSERAVEIVKQALKFAEIYDRDHPERPEGEGLDLAVDILRRDMESRTVDCYAADMAEVDHAFVMDGMQMDPTIKPGDLVFLTVKPFTEDLYGHVIAFSRHNHDIDGQEIIVGRLCGIQGGRAMLCMDNRAYGPAEGLNLDDFLGECVGITRSLSPAWLEE